MQDWTFGGRGIAPESLLRFNTSQCQGFGSDGGGREGEREGGREIRKKGGGIENTEVLKRCMLIRHKIAFRLVGNSQSFRIPQKDCEISRWQKDLEFREGRRGDQSYSELREAARKTSEILPPSLPPLLLPPLPCQSPAGGFTFQSCGMQTEIDAAERFVILSLILQWIGSTGSFVSWSVSAHSIRS